MSSSIIFPDCFPEAVKPGKHDVVTAAKAQNWKELNDVVICQNSAGEVTAKFADESWDIQPYLSRIGAGTRYFDFSTFNSSDSLQLELKLIVYGWLFHKSGKTNKPSKITTLIGRFSYIRKAYFFLMENGCSSLSELSNQRLWSKFENSLENQSYSQQTLELIFVAINSALLLQPWLKVDFNLPRLKPTELAKKLNKQPKQQTLTIPERLSDSVYAKAIELVEFALPYCDVIAETEKNLQENYLEGKKAVDSKIQSGQWSWLTDEHGRIIDNHRYAQEINKILDGSHKSILQQRLGQISGLSDIVNGLDFQRYYGQLITACYICCGAFSGMRDSELSELTPESYYSETFNGRTFHLLQSRTFKLGEKRETWVAAPIAEKAIQLAATLTLEWRSQLQRENISFHNLLWLNHTARSKPPVSISDWNKRLQRFCKQFGLIVTEADYRECVESNPNSQARVKKDVVVGKPWKLTPHQFRRSLAFYTIKHRLGTNISLKQQFKHLYLQMTEWYTNGGRLASLKALKVDSELQQLLDNSNDESTTNKIFNMVHSDKKLSGSHGKAIVKMRGDVPHIYSSWDVIYDAVKKKTLTLHGTTHSYCKNGYNCDMDGIWNPAFCVDCSSGSSIIDEENAKWWQSKHTQLTAYIANESDISSGDYSHCITQIRAAEIVMTDFGMIFIPYKHPIEVSNL